MLYERNHEPFELNINGMTLRATSHEINDADVFRLVFSDGRPPLLITESFIGSKISRHDLWISIPRGREKEAGYFGKMIKMHFKNK